MTLTTTSVSKLKPGDIVWQSSQVQVVVEAIPMFIPGQWSLILVRMPTGEVESMLVSGSDLIATSGRIADENLATLVADLRAQGVISPEHLPVTEINEKGA